MKVQKTAIPDALIIEPDVFEDERGYFFESFNIQEWTSATGLKTVFVQDNHSRSEKDVLRGLHYQVRQPQGKLVRCVVGGIFTVAVDLRADSPSFGKWIGEDLTAANMLQMWVPEGFANGFLVLTETAEVLYKVTDFYAPEFEQVIRWNDPDIGIDWPLTSDPVLSKRDQLGTAFKSAQVYGQIPEKGER